LNLAQNCCVDRKAFGPKEQVTTSLEMSFNGDM